MFFSKPGEYEPCGMLSIGHVILLTITICAIIVAIKFTKIQNKEDLRKIIRNITIIAWCMEIIKIIFNLCIGNANNINTYVPLYYCSILLYAGLFSSFGKGIIKRVGDVFLATGALVGGVTFLFFPTTSLPAYPMFHYISVQSFAYHGMMIYLAVLIIKNNYIELENKDIIYYFGFFIVICCIALIFNNIFGSNLMFISQNFPNTIVNVIYTFSGKFFTPIMILCQATLPFYAVYLVLNINRKQNKGDNNAVTYIRSKEKITK